MEAKGSISHQKSTHLRHFEKLNETKGEGIKGFEKRKAQIPNIWKYGSHANKTRSRIAGITGATARDA